ncbi:3-(3-hydroxy-phenyl)propionate hydroxylase [Polaromonas sp. OV174]|uniref:FAD-dependent oxidoreductase n=1 Tax=Polaromonas sp. OV174 TaxID=1855300 RepID=UPI0008EC6282|nr:FAD-dependent monooxygenase [Polaromonas sp. OV174]SFC03189.1 3-(3-hydroxy-phenyl)propionate hydroxylase [Polaromonas sp. OV174]
MNTRKLADQRVIIVGAGPVGLTTAMLLGHYGIECLVLEAAAEVPHDLRASTFHPPTLDMLEDFGITSRLIEAGLVAPTWQVRWHTTGEFAEFDLSILKDHTAHPYRLQCEQWKLAEYLLEHIRDRLPGIEVLNGHRVQKFLQHADSVDVVAQGPDGELQSFTGAYLIGADGARSIVRSQLALAFDGHTFPETTVLATTSFRFHEHIPDLSFINYCWKESGTFSLLRLRDLWRVSLYPRDGESDEEAVAPASIQAKLQEIHPKAEPYDVLEIRPYRIHQRVVQQYVHDRVVLVGDAAHINSPSGGMGMNGGIHDAFNLAEKLSRIYAGESTELLQLYERQRRPIAVKHVLEQSGRNRARMQERDTEKRRRSLTDLQQKASDKALATQYLLETSMISGLREATAIR